jgi:hypothetical protein
MNKKNTPAAVIMQREVTRKEFLATLGLGLASIMGFSNLIKLLTGKSVNSRLNLDHRSESGYGASPYGR